MRDLLFVFDPSRKAQTARELWERVHAGGGQSHRLVAATAKVSCSDGWSAWSATVRTGHYSLVRIIAISRSRPLRQQRFGLAPRRAPREGTTANRPSHMCASHATRLVFGLAERRLDTKVTRRFCESASRTATAGPPPPVTIRTVSSPALESRRPTIVAGLPLRGAPAAPRGSYGSQVAGPPESLSGCRARAQLTRFSSTSGCRRASRHTSW
jgi:hypothetical protein